MEDWAEIISILRDAGMTQAEIAHECDCSDSTISELRTRKIANPAYPVGKKLMALYALKAAGPRPSTFDEAA